MKAIIYLMVTVLISVVIRLTDGDVAASSLFFDPETNHFDQSSHWILVNKYLNAVPIFIFINSIIVFCGGYFIKKWERYRKKTLFCVLVMVLAPGLIVNGLFKPTWGRPRPHEIKQFGGTEVFVPVLTPGERKSCDADDLDDAGKMLAVIGIEKQRYESFPSGHTSAAFYMIVLYFIARHNKWRWYLLLLGIGYGFLMGVSRIATGHHFLSDILWSGVIVWLTASVLDNILNKKRRQNDLLTK